MPFVRANYSLFASNMNEMLLHFGLNGVSHDHLDYAALANPFDSFEAHFARHLAAANPGLDLTKAEH